MAGAITSDTGRRMQPNVQPNVIPFIDVLLVLLIIFMVTAPKPTTDIRVDAPTLSGPASHARPTIVAIFRADGALRIEVDGETTSPGDLAGLVLARAAANNPTTPTQDLKREARIFVRADLDVAYQSVISVMDELYGAQFARIGVYAQDADA
ncbi:biopolymer transport protein ExbD/tolR [alpha proteobacterium U9-1i]|nr:biopolymer transport protein ExbD/tolR [alpha proteobacterium U9-1i]